jgi:hypothetical protein
MTVDYDHRAEAANAMEMALAATNEHERLSWIRVALAWQSLTRLRKVDGGKSAVRGGRIDPRARLARR